MPSNNRSKAIILITALFFLWGIALNLNSILIPHLKKACQLNYTQSALIDSASFIAYFLIAVPGGYIHEKIWIQERDDIWFAFICGWCLSVLSCFRYQILCIFPCRLIYYCKRPGFPGNRSQSLYDCTRRPVNCCPPIEFCAVI